jgi:glycosyltransferase A (GT-A) superfamily protein (DUF2064 family)
MKHLDRASFLRAYNESGRSPSRTARALGITERNVAARLQRIEKELGYFVREGRGTQFKARVERSLKPSKLELLNGVVIVGSDAHYWPGEIATGHRAMVELCSILSPDIVVMNGDEFDGAMLSRHAPIGWEDTPMPMAELKTCQMALEEIAEASPNALHLGTFGNHTIRLDTHLATHAAAVQGVAGTKFEDHFPNWEYRWAFVLNEHTLIKHRLRSGVHATWNNTADTHLNIITGHCHAQQVRPRTTLSPLNGGTIYGVDAGMLADPWGPQFRYMEQGPRNWRAGCAVLTFRNGILMPPELAQVVGPNEVFFRGNVLTV